MTDLKLQLGRAVRFIDGAPDITGLPCDAISAGEAGEYMRRYHLEYTRNRSVRLHHILASDPGDVMHDHPWDSVSVLLAGAITEITPDGAIRYEAPCLITRQAEQLHRLVLDAPAWTYFVTGRVRRIWGSATDGGWVPWRQHPRGTQLQDCDPGLPDRSW
jgi:hypothetical protein